MDHYEMVEKLRQKANVSYEEAKAALEACDWDVLDALVLLESEGKVKHDPGAEYTTQETAQTTGKVEVEWNQNVKDGLRKACHLLRKLFQKGNTNTFRIRNRRNEELISMPITVLVLVLFFCWPLSLILLVVGLFLGGRYSFHGPDMNDKVNHVMDKAADAVQSSDSDQAE